MGGNSRLLEEKRKIVGPVIEDLRNRDEIWTAFPWGMRPASFIWVLE